jgi:imidazolonepropionase-like amidohydrolase
MLAGTLDQFRQLQAAGVRFVAGTDAGWRYTGFDSLPFELWLMTEGGMTAAGAIAAATGDAAAVLGIGSVTGTLAPGRAADIIAVRGNPLEDVRRLADIRLVVQAGQILSDPGAGQVSDAAPR